MNLASELLSAGAPAAPAICVGAVEISYAELRARVDRMARVLLARGCARHEPVAIWSENGVFFVVSYLAVIAAGLTAVPLQTDSSPETAAGLVRDAGIRMVLVSSRQSGRLAGWAGDAPVEILSEAEVARPHRLYRGALPDVNPSRDLAALMYTSGSTGKPKGVMVTHRNILSNTRDIIGYLGLSSADRAMVVLPFHYCFGLSVLHTHLAVGASVVINNELMYPERVVQEIEARACTGFAGVPSTYHILLRRSRFKQAVLPLLRWLQQAGGELPGLRILEIAEAFPRARFYVMYGQTEGTARLSYLPPERLLEKLGSIGKGLRSTRLEILRTDGLPVAPGSDEVGEVVASGDSIGLGYWNDRAETAKTFRDGRLYTGDLARVDAEGFIYLVGRQSDIIKVGGNRVGAREVAAAIENFPDVVEVTVVGARHELMGEAIVAFVVISPEAQINPPDVLNHCRRRLPPFKVPEAVVYVPSLPHSESGKVLTPVLKQFAADVMRSGSGDVRDSLSEGQRIRVLRIEQRGRAVA